MEKPKHLSELLIALKHKISPQELQTLCGHRLVPALPDALKAQAVCGRRNAIVTGEPTPMECWISFYKAEGDLYRQGWPAFFQALAKEATFKLERPDATSLFELERRFLG